MVTFTPVSSRHKELEVTHKRKQGGFWAINEEGDGPPWASGDPWYEREVGLRLKRGCHQPCDEFVRATLSVDSTDFGSALISLKANAPVL